MGFFDKTKADLAAKKIKDFIGGAAEVTVKEIDGKYGVLIKLNSTYVKTEYMGIPLEFVYEDSE